MWNKAGKEESSPYKVLGFCSGKQGQTQGVRSTTFKNKRDAVVVGR